MEWKHGALRTWKQRARLPRGLELWKHGVPFVIFNFFLTMVKCMPLAGPLS